MDVLRQPPNEVRQHLPRDLDLPAAFDTAPHAVRGIQDQLDGFRYSGGEKQRPLLTSGNHREGSEPPHVNRFMAAAKLQDEGAQRCGIKCIGPLFVPGHRPAAVTVLVIGQEPAYPGFPDAPILTPPPHHDPRPVIQFIKRPAGLRDLILADRRIVLHETDGGDNPRIVGRPAHLER